MRPVIYLASVSKVIVDNNIVDVNLVPEYYRPRIAEVPIWFELSSPLMNVDVDGRLATCVAPSFIAGIRT
jgi:hypothetical protein